MVRTYTPNSAFSYLGQGIKHPLEIVRGRIAYEQALALVEQSMRIILNTPIGTQFFNPDFGSEVKDALFEPNDEVMEGMLAYSFDKAISTWEPRTQYIDATFEYNDEGWVNCLIQHKLLNSRDVETFIYPLKRSKKY